VTDPHPGQIAAPGAARDVAAKRACLRCKKEFDSKGFGERICPRCKASAVWKSAVPLLGARGRKT